MAEPGDKSGLSAEGAKAVYDRLANDRAPYVTRAENNASYTIPAVFPKESDNGSTNYVTPYQSVGARGLNNLAAKMLLSLFPVGEPFFKLAINEFALKQVGDTEVVQQASIGLSLVERVAMRYVEGASIRPTAFEGMKQLLVAGNFLWYMPPGEQTMRLYRLTSYVVERDSNGGIIQGVTKESIAAVNLPDDLKELVEGGGQENPNQQVDVYTHFYRDVDSDQWLSYQEIAGEVVESSKNTFPKDGLPWIPVRLFKIDGESYGRSFVEEYIGDLVSLENLSKSIVEFAQAASKVLFLVEPSGVTQARRLTKAANGSFVAGRKSDISVFQMEKYNDFQVAKSTADGIEQRLSYAFLLNSAVQRNAERVTAEEIRFVANELEATLGGVYSVLSSEFQLPMAKRVLIDLQLTNKIPDLPQEAVEPTVVTGLDAIGRGQDLDKLMTFTSAASVAFQQTPGEINWSNYILRIAEATGIDPQGLIPTPQERQAAQAAQIQQQAALSAAQAGGAAAGQNVGAAGTQDEAAMAQAVQSAQG